MGSGQIRGARDAVMTPRTELLSCPLSRPEQMEQIARMTIDLEKKLADLCKEKGMRLTGQRRMILKVLAESPDHPDAEELHHRVGRVAPGISLATVYRTVNTLENCGLIERHSVADGRARYEASNSEHHDHFVNVETDEVIEFRCDEIEQLQQKIAEEHGFEIVGHKLEIYVRPRPDRHRLGKDR